MHWCLWWCAFPHPPHAVCVWCRCVAGTDGFLVCGVSLSLLRVWLSSCFIGFAAVWVVYCGTPVCGRGCVYDVDDDGGMTPLVYSCITLIEFMNSEMSLANSSNVYPNGTSSNFRSNIARYCGFVDVPLTVKFFIICLCIEARSLAVIMFTVSGSRELAM